MDFYGMRTLNLNLDIEQRASYSDEVLVALESLCGFTNFKLDIDCLDLCSKVVAEIKEFPTTESLACRYENIQDIDDERYQEMIDQMERFDAGLLDMLQFLKHRFKGGFADSVSKGVICHSWNHDQKCVEGMRHLGLIDKHLVLLSTRLPEKYQVPDAAYVIYVILKENGIAVVFSFAKVPTTYTESLYSKIFNAYFGEDIYTQEKRGWSITAPFIEPSQLRVFALTLPDVHPDSDDEDAGA
ncbi:hypothetical protein HK097_004574 [Rhizophlyctis rosea]|uniref:Uncharacterized protein n=1 Tax=Rhizophlyctis rosea TaxID=64517 RepID=A0AAD5S1C5_9FUNG|nr:hypothetical protein HK097_004574 [Rhizophlyctis rosea]